MICPSLEDFVLYNDFDWLGHNDQAARQSIDKNNNNIASGVKDETSTQRPATASSPRISSLQIKMKWSTLLK